MKTVILFTTHLNNEFVRNQIIKLYREVNNIASLCILYQSDNHIGDFPEDVNVYPFSIDSISNLGYKPLTKTILPGSNHFPVLQFFMDFPNFDYYWNIEYDVFFSGNWFDFFSWFENKKEDFISSHIIRYENQPQWPHWDKLRLNGLPQICNIKKIRSFNPIYRISKRGLSFLDNFLRQGHVGHHEVLIPTIFYKNGFSIADFGGVGEFSYTKYPNLFYTADTMGDKRIYTSDSTMRYRPVYKLDDVKLSNKLYHPIKKYI